MRSTVRSSGSWQVRLDSGWVDVDPIAAQQMCAATANGTAMITLNMNGFKYTMDLINLKQINTKTGKARDLRFFLADGGDDDVYTTTPHRGGPGTWQVRLDNRGWTRMEPAVEQRLSSARRAGERAVDVTIRGFDYSMDLVAMKQRNKRSKKMRGIRYLEGDNRLNNVM